MADGATKKPSVKKKFRGLCKRVKEFWNTQLDEDPETNIIANFDGPLHDSTHSALTHGMVMSEGCLGRITHHLVRGDDCDGGDDVDDDSETDVDGPEEVEVGQDEDVAAAGDKARAKSVVAFLRNQSKTVEDRQSVVYAETAEFFGQSATNASTNIQFRMASNNLLHDHARNTGVLELRPSELEHLPFTMTELPDDDPDHSTTEGDYKAYKISFYCDVEGEERLLSVRKKGNGDNFKLCCSRADDEKAAECRVFERITVAGKNVFRAKWGERKDLFLGLKNGSSQDTRVVAIMKEPNFENIKSNASAHISIIYERE